MDCKLEIDIDTEWGMGEMIRVNGMGWDTSDDGMDRWMDGLS